ncbi:homoserine O-succinyltransferase [Campylobacter sp. MIT 12-5580]|uniref:homoserine O-succinyltransferase n=1 Tax=Campylobacter sp. MIT 12-5580 TaxID=2040651 RepID=UPI0010F452CB|nr:homoserine O-succinyltransferase [Campylobacter sp. MIT 12-5580]TKX28357.1 homoserine O-succinyltransferase [Campylobacter sp. MIT 12-5580]
MPLIIPKEIPAFNLLKDFTFIIDETRAITQDIRPLKVLIFNLMPTKIETENQLLSLLGNSPLQVEITLLKTKSYESKNTDKNHLDRFYVSLDEIRGQKFDGAIVTGAPIEHLDFEEVAYWQEFAEILNYLRTHTTSTLYLCWGAMAALYHFHQIQKISLKKKLFGVFEHEFVSEDLLLSGLDESVKMPHSRHSGINEAQIRANESLKILLEGKQSGISMIRDFKDVFILAHPEYAKFTLDAEYKRDLDKGESIEKPLHYYDENGKISFCWRSNASVIFHNWLNFVYQVTPYQLSFTSI